MDTTEHDDDVKERPFAAIVREIRGGALHDEVTEALARVTAAVAAHRKAGKVVITLKVKPTKGSALTVEDTVKADVPEAERPETFFWSDHGALVRNDPNQLAFDGMKAVEGGRDDTATPTEEHTA